MRAKSNVSLMLSIALMCTVGCNDFGRPTGVGNPSGEFTYTGYDLNGEVVFTGTMMLHQQGNQILGERNLKGTRVVVDSGPIGGTVNADGSFVAVFDPTKVLYAYVSVVGSEWPTIRSFAGDVFSSSGTAYWSLKTGTFKLTPLI